MVIGQHHQQLLLLLMMMRRAAAVAYGAEQAGTPAYQLACDTWQWT